MLLHCSSPQLCKRINRSLTSAIAAWIRVQNHFSMFFFFFRRVSSAKSVDGKVFLVTPLIGFRETVSPPF